MRPTLMALEARSLLSTIVVNNPTDVPVMGQIDLRQAIAMANTNGGNETITFDKTVFNTPQTITLDPTLGQLELTDTTGTTTIVGPKAGVTVDAGRSSRVFQVDGGVTASISGMTITDGKTTGNGGALLIAPRAQPRSPTAPSVPARLRAAAARSSTTARSSPRTPPSRTIRLCYSEAQLMSKCCLVPLTWSCLIAASPGTRRPQPAAPSR
jgi:hypothetical protein